VSRKVAGVPLWVLILAVLAVVYYLRKRKG